MAKTLVAMFDSLSDAEQARTRLLQSGIETSSVHITNEESLRTRASSDERDHRGFFSRLFGLGDSDERVGTYNEAISRGSSMLTVTLDDDSDATRVESLLSAAGAMDIDERSRDWQQGSTGLAGRDTASLQGRERLEVVQEELQVGKRAVETGGVRVHQYVTERPVQEQVTLCEERAIVQRRPVDRVLSPGEFESMDLSDRDLEIRERSEQAVVGKTARVVEEVEVGKESRERTETIQDSVRRKDVDVEQLAATNRTSTTQGDLRDRPLR